MRGFALGERGVGYELLTRDYSRLEVPSRPHAAFTRRVKAGPVAMNVVDVACCRGMSGNMNNQG